MELGSSAFDRFAVTYDPGDIIFCEYEPGDAFYLIQTGRVQITKIVGEIEKTIDVLHPGEIFGEMAILEEEPRSASAVAIDQVRVLEFNRANFDVLMQGNPQIALKLLKLLSKRIYDQRRRFMILKLEDPQARVGDVFLMLNETDAATYSEGSVRAFSIQVDDVAHWAGMSPEQCRRVLDHFVNQGRMEIRSEEIRVFNINELSRLVATRRKGVKR